jgi:hypothetical protein
MIAVVNLQARGTEGEALDSPDSFIAEEIREETADAPDTGLPHFDENGRRAERNISIVFGKKFEKKSAAFFFKA